MTNLELIHEHQNSTAFFSALHSMRGHSTTYAQIMDKGMSMVPDILEYLEENDGCMSIMLLLWDLTKESPYKPEMIDGSSMASYDVEKARSAWIEWGKNYLKDKACSK